MINYISNGNGPCPPGEKKGWLPAILTNNPVRKNFYFL